MFEDWQHLLQSIIIGLIFSFLLAKLISIITAFRHDNLSITRTAIDEQASISSPRHVREPSNESLISEIDDDYDDDWEGVESTELDEAFSSATAFVAAYAAEKMSGGGGGGGGVGSDVQVQLYGLYKIATEGPCGAPPPPVYKVKARSKWNAWRKLGAMPPEDAMQKYIDIVTELFPTWASGGEDVKDAGGHSSESKGPMGPVFSSFIHEEESGLELKMDAVHVFAREGDLENLLKSIETGSSVNLKDSEGRTPLHWAVDRGHLPIIELLCSKDADINSKDNEGQTPLHYSVVCDRKAIAEYLVKHNADFNIKDNEGVSPSELCEKNWPWMQTTGEVIE